MSRRNSASKKAPYRYIEAFQSSQLTECYVGVIDASTDKMTFCIYSTPNFKLMAKQEFLIKTFTPKDGWFEQDPLEYMSALNRCCLRAFAYLTAIGHNNRGVTTLGITNQRETIILWDRFTGDPLYNAILWKDNRSAKIVDEVLAKVPGKNRNHFKQICGLPLSPYFSAPKISWLLQNVPAVRKACQDGRCLAGTVDSWIIWNLTKGSLHITDVTNASRTFLMNIHTLRWDPQLLEAFSIDINILPEIRSSSEIYGRVHNVTSEFHGMQISGILGNQQASLLGQMCTQPGDAKNTYSSSCFLICNTGKKCLVSKYGLLTTIAYQLGPKAPIIYALEGAVAVAGHALDWLHRQVRIVPDLKEVSSLARAVVPARGGNVYFVPAFTGLYSPHWRKDARGVICGITDFTTKNHIVLAALEAICFQVHDILECKHLEGVFQLRTLYADGELTANDYLMQLQADVGGITVVRSHLKEAAAFGVALCAAQADGIRLFDFTTGLQAMDKVAIDEFSPKTSYKERKRRYIKWRRAVEFSLGWAVEDTKIPSPRPKLVKNEPKLVKSEPKPIETAIGQPASSSFSSAVSSSSSSSSPSPSSDYDFVNSIPLGVYVALTGLMVLRVALKSVSRQ